MLNVNFFCNFNHTGVGRHCENAYLGMSNNRPPDVCLHYVNTMRESSVRRTLAGARADSDVTIFFWRYPVAFVRQFPGRKVIWWFFESDRLPRKWLEDIDPYDQIWAPSPWAMKVLDAHGFSNGRVAVLESGVNSRIFRPAPVAHDGFVFLAVGKYENRKSIDEAVAAFIAEFPAAEYPKVQLWLKADYPLFPQRVAELRQRIAPDPRIRVISGIFSDEQMAVLYNSADAFVFPSKAEGFGLPCLEAIACAVPVIATNVSAQSVFLDRIQGLYWPVEHQIVPLEDADYQHFYGADYAGEDFGRWAIPSIVSLRQGMRELFEHSATWRERAVGASQIVREEFSWDRIGRKAVESIARLPQGG
jgi:hypothetical protein